MWTQDTVKVGAASEPQTPTGLLTPRRSDVPVDVSVFRLNSRRNRWRSSSATSFPGPGVYYLSPSDGAKANSQKKGHMRISEAKAILAEAVTSYPASTAPPAKLSSRSHHSFSQNHGAVAPLVLMLSTCRDALKLEAALSTFTLLLMDSANCRSALQINCVPAVLEAASHLAGGHPRQMVAVLAALTPLCRHSSDAKHTLWSHPSSTCLLELLQPTQRTDTIIASLHVFSTLAFATNNAAADNVTSPVRSSYSSSHSSPLPNFAPTASAFLNAPCSLLASNRSSSSCLSNFSSSSALEQLGRRHLLAPALLSSCVVLLQQARSSEALLLTTFEFLTAAADVPLAEHSPSWHQVLYSTVPLLHSALPSVAEAALGMLLVLSEHAAFQRVMYAAGCVSPLLAFLAPSLRIETEPRRRSGSAVPLADVASRSSSIGGATSGRLTATTSRCSSLAVAVLCGLSTGGLTRDQLAQADYLASLVAALASTACEEVVIGVLQILSNLAASRPASVLAFLRQKGMVALLRDIVAATDDADVVTASSGLSKLLGEQAGRSVSVSLPTSASPLPTMARPVFDECHTADSLQCSAVACSTPPLMIFEALEDGSSMRAKPVPLEESRCTVFGTAGPFTCMASVASAGDISVMTATDQMTRSCSVITLEAVLLAAAASGGGSSGALPSSSLDLAKPSSVVHSPSRFHQQYRRRPSQQLAEQYRRQQALKQLQQASQQFICATATAVCC